MQHEHLQLVSGFVAPLSLLAFLHTTSPLAPDLELDTKIRIGESGDRYVECYIRLRAVCPDATHQVEI